MSMLVALMLSSITARGVINPIVLAAPSGSSSALFLVLRNSSQNEDRLVRVTCTCAERIEILAARRGDLALEGESVTLPPQRLVELRPGGSRQLRLLRLRRTLVAGETVAMTFHYAQGSETRDVAVVADAEAVWAAGRAREGRVHRLAALEPLAGSCWRGASPDGRKTETRCFSATYNMFMQDRATVEEGGTTRVRYTMYFHDVMGRTITFRDDGRDGQERAGRVVPDDAGLLFEDYPVNAAGRATTRTSWRRDGPDAWLVRGEMRFPTGWRESWRLRPVRAGPAPPAD